MKFTHRVGDEIANHRILKVIPAKRWAMFKRKGKKMAINDPRVTVECLKCGHVKEVNGTRLKWLGCDRGPCHPNFVNLKGQRFGGLRVLEWVLSESDGKRSKLTCHWRCECDCGNRELVSRGSLLAGKRMCNVCKHKHVAERNRLPGFKSVWNRVIRDYKRAAGNRKYHWWLTDAEAMSIMQQPCAYCGSLPMKDKPGLTRNGIDRINNDADYTVDNVVPSCFTCNRMKNDHSIEAFVNHVRKIYYHLSSERSETIPEGSTPKRVEMENPSSRESGGG